MISANDFDYSLPDSLIANEPLPERTSSRLLVLDRTSGKIAHHHFADLPSLLKTGDVLVRNQTKVFPARIFAEKTSGKSVELLLLHPVVGTGTQWQCLTKPGVKPGEALRLTPKVTATNLSETKSYTKVFEFSCSTDELFSLLEKHGQTPLPPYIHNQTPENIRRRQYQTTYAQTVGSAAAPTAGLHFTPALDQALTAAGIAIAPITLHVGLGTFAPLRDESFASKSLHSEWYELSSETATIINQAKQSGRRIVAIGTTTVRTLESAAMKHWPLQPHTGETTLFIYPPYSFQVVDAMVTNFHLPKSSLLALVSAFVTQPNGPETFHSFAQSSIGTAYQTAITERYRFFSFGDAMLIL